MKEYWATWKQTLKKKLRERRNWSVLITPIEYRFHIHTIFLLLFQTCFFCKLKGASIGCDLRSCKKSFHLTCGIQNNCLTQFFGNYKSFCHLHHKIDRSTIHSEAELCVLCAQEMGKFHPVASIELPCCNDRWYHSKCLKDMVNKQSAPRCRTCGDEDSFRIFLQTNGIFVPERYVETIIQRL